MHHKTLQRARGSLAGKNVSEHCVKSKAVAAEPVSGCERIWPLLVHQVHVTLHEPRLHARLLLRVAVLFFAFPAKTTPHSQLNTESLCLVPPLLSQSVEAHCLDCCFLNLVLPLPSSTSTGSASHIHCKGSVSPKQPITNSYITRKHTQHHGLVAPCSPLLGKGQVEVSATPLAANPLKVTVLTISLLFVASCCTPTTASLTSQPSTAGPPFSLRSSTPSTAPTMLSPTRAPTSLPRLRRASRSSKRSPHSSMT